MSDRHVLARERFADSRASVQLILAADTVVKRGRLGRCCGWLFRATILLVEFGELAFFVTSVR